MFVQLNDASGKEIFLNLDHVIYVIEGGKSGQGKKQWQLKTSDGKEHLFEQQEFEKLLDVLIGEEDE